MPGFSQQMSEQEEGERGPTGEEILGARGGGRGRAALPGGMRGAAGAPSPRSRVSPCLLGDSGGVPRPSVGSAGTTCEPRSPTPGGSGPPRPATSPWE